MSAPSATTRFVCSALLILVFTACSGDDGNQSTLDKETFVATYVDLRAAALRSSARQISDEERTQVLAEHGVTEDDLLTFAAEHGRDVTYMRDLWDDVEQRLDEMKPTIDKVGQR